MSSPAEILRAVLVGAGLVSLPPVPGKEIPTQQLPGDSTTVCFVSSMPDEIDQAVGIYDTAGLLFGKEMRTPRELLHPGIQVEVRTLDYTGYDLANTIAQKLDTIGTTTVVLGSTTHYIQSVYRTSPVIAMGEEINKKRQCWSINARIAFQNQEPPLG